MLESAFLDYQISSLAKTGRQEFTIHQKRGSKLIFLAVSPQILTKDHVDGIYLINIQESHSGLPVSRILVHCNHPRS
jgi:hypothetical protein